MGLIFLKVNMKGNPTPLDMPSYKVNQISCLTNLKNAGALERK